MVDNGEYPFAKVEADGWEVYGKGKLKYVRFGGADMYARKSLADPDMVSHSYVHHFEAPGNSVYPFLPKFLTSGSAMEGDQD